MGVLKDLLRGTFQLKYISRKNNKSFFLIAGPCIIESREETLKIANTLKSITDKLEIPFIDPLAGICCVWEQIKKLLKLVEKAFDKVKQIVEKAFNAIKKAVQAFKEYVNRWAYKHPGPDDFFRTMENVSGEDLGWFWRSWILNNWKLDQAVTDVSYKKNFDKIYKAKITIKNMEKIPMPVEIEITTASGAKIMKNLPVEVWKRNVEWSFMVDVSEEISSVIIDPYKKYPDVNSANNVWPVK